MHIKRWLLALLLLSPLVHAQVSNPSIISVSTAPSGACTSGLPNQQVISTGVQYSCQGGTWAAIGGGGGTTTNPLTFNTTGGAAPGTSFNGSAAVTVSPVTIGAATASGASPATNAVVASPNCNASQSNCYQVYDDGQVAMTAAYTTTVTGGQTATLATTNSDTMALAYIPNATSAGYLGATMTQSSALGWESVGAAFKSAGAGGTLGTCWGTNQQSGSATTITQSITPIGGSGHVLIAMSRSGTSLTSIAFTDNSGSNTWANLASLTGAIQGTSLYSQAAYAANIAAGSYTVTATFGTTQQFRGIYVCEISGLVTSGVLDGTPQVLSSINGQTTIAGGASPLSANDFVFVTATVAGTGNTFSAASFGGQWAVTTQTSDPPFISTDVGKKIVSTTLCNATNGFEDCYEAMHGATIASYIDSHHITATGSLLMPSASTGTNFTGWFIWGHDDANQLASAWAYTLTNPSMTLNLPCGVMLIGSSPFLSASTGSWQNPHLQGCGPDSSTILVPLSDFTYGSASGGLIYSYPATNDTPYPYGFQNPFYWASISNLSIWGGGADGSNVSTALPIFAISLVKMTDVWVTGWNWNARTGANGMPVVSGAGMVLERVKTWSAGTGGVLVNGDQEPTVVINIINDSTFGLQTDGRTPYSLGNAVILTTTSSSGHLVSRGNYFFPPTARASLAPAGVILGGEWKSSQDAIGGLSATGGYLYLDQSSTTLSGYGLTIASSGYVKARDTEIDAITMSGGKFYDQGGNFLCTVALYTTCNTLTGSWVTGSPSITGGTVYSDDLGGPGFNFSAAGTPLPSWTAFIASGTKAAVSDALIPTYLGTYAGSGSSVVPVVWNGSNWQTH
jgi:hypothetical protein